MTPRIFQILILGCLLAGKAAAFVFYPVGNNPLRWNVENGLAHTNIVNSATKAVRYFIASDTYSAAHRDAEIAAVQACFDQWQSVPGSALKFEFAGFVSPAGLEVKQDNTNVVFWAKQSTFVGSGMNISGLRAWTSVHFANDGSILEGDIVLNGVQFQWFTDFSDTVNQAQFIESVLLHEIGHFVGLDHSVAGGASLAIGDNGVSPEAGLSHDEVAAMRFLYPHPSISPGKISGTVRLNGSGILGASVIADDANGNLAGATVTRVDGTYDLAGLAAGTYNVRVTPLDPANAGNERLIRGIDVAPEYKNAVTAFSATTNVPTTVLAGQVTVRHFNVSTGPLMRITSLSKPTTIPDLISVYRTTVTLQPGQANVIVAVNGATLKNGSVLSITGAGITMGPTTFLENRIAGNIETLVATVSVSSNAPAGLRSFVVTHGNDVAYANGFIEIAAPFPDFNFDGLDDVFQREFWIPWTRAESAPANDPDGDLFSNAFEYRTGTNPTNTQSFRLPITLVSREADATHVTVQTDPGKRYQLYARDAFNSESWDAVGRTLTSNGPEMTFAHTSDEGTKFYRVAQMP